MVLNDPEKRDTFLSSPITKGSSDSRHVTNGGIIRSFVKTITTFDIKKWKNRALENLFSIYDDTTNNRISLGEQWEIATQFDRSYSSEEERAKQLNDLGGIEYCEQNLEVLLLKHAAAY